MKLLTKTDEIEKTLIRLMDECTSLQVAVAWASVGFDAFDALVKNSAKIEKMVVGTHFYQTHPLFIEAFIAHPAVRFMMNTDGVFHPKMYHFQKEGGGWECLVGSPNFTGGGMGGNQEIAIVLTHLDEGAEESLARVQAAMAEYWQDSTAISQEGLEAYRDAWKRKRPVVKNLGGKFGGSNERSDDGGKFPSSLPMLQMSWMEYFNSVRSEKDHAPHDHSMEGRLIVIREVRRLFDESKHFNELDPINRQKIAGLVMENGVNYLWFGSMRGAGYFKQAIGNNDTNISLALDAIPNTGTVSRKAYDEYVERFKCAFPNGGDGIATSTRLLAMKRPDVFVCLDARNMRGLCDKFGISRNVGYKEYWDSIIERIREAIWWNAEPPNAPVEREVWQARAAFLDALFYDGKDMPAI